MSRTTFIAALLALLAALFALLALAAPGCNDSAAPPAAAPRPETEVRTGTASRELEQQKKILDDEQKEEDAVAHGLMGSFESRVYDPRRDSLLEHAEGTIKVTTSAGDAAYGFVYDSTYPAERPVRFETVSEPAAADRRTMADVRNWANLACLGAFPVVVYFRPPIPWQVVSSTDRKNQIVVAPVFRTQLSVSYSIDARQVVVARAEWSDATHKYVTNYDWDPFGGGRYLLRRAVLFEGSTTEFEYGDHEGVHLLDRVHVKDREHPVEATFTYQALRRRAH